MFDIKFITNTKLVHTFIIDGIIAMILVITAILLSNTKVFYNLILPPIVVTALLVILMIMAVWWHLRMRRTVLVLQDILYNSYHRHHNPTCYLATTKYWIIIWKIGLIRWIITYLYCVPNSVQWKWVASLIFSHLCPDSVCALKMWGQELGQQTYCQFHH